jgi:tetratricopeptide (TPR) repeat protein
MIGLTSSSAGVLLLQRPGADEYSVLDVVGGEEQDPIEAQYLYSAAQDWKEIEGTDANTLLETATREYWLARSVSLLRLAIAGLDVALEKDTLEHIEEILGSHVSPVKVLDRLLVAPLRDPNSILALAKSALRYGFATVASILDKLVDLQPLLQRFTDLWLGLAASTFSHFSEPREIIWMMIVEKGELQQLLRAGGRSGFTTKWNLLAFHFSTAQSRGGIQQLGEDICGHLFPSMDREETTTAHQEEEAGGDHRIRPGRMVENYEMFERVKKQVASIEEAVSQGNDAIAEKFLRQLVEDQTSSPGGEDHAVKSLCNIAKRCADMFRSDFEAICLKEARKLAPFDAWTLIQCGDHLKRMGDYDEALKTFEKAGGLGESVVAKSSEADVYAHQGNYEKAILTYKTITEWHDLPAVRNGIADNLRRMGRLDDAKSAYTELADLARAGTPGFAECGIRAQAGLAEIARRTGNLDDALDIYKQILEHEPRNERDRMFCQLGLCNVLTLMEKFDEAHSVVDKIIQAYPFNMQARFIRGSILGLIGREPEGLTDLPESKGSRSSREWLRCYCRGLLLLRLNRYEDAKKNLVEEFPRAIASGEEKAVLRMAAALCFLVKNEPLEADKFLSLVPDLDNCHAHYLSLVLKLHSATQKKDSDTISSLKEKIAGLQVDEKLERAVVALVKRDFAGAITHETVALLKLAA